MPFAAGLATTELFLEAAQIAAASIGNKNVKNMISWVTDVIEDQKYTVVAAGRNNLRGQIVPKDIKAIRAQATKAARNANVNNLRGSVNLAPAMEVDEG